jgi:hypothetical protein
VAHGLEHIDWSVPWLAPYRAWGQPLAQLVVQGAGVAQALNAGAAQFAIESIAVNSIPKFVPQAELPAGMAYEQFIFDERRVPTRDGLHDFFNGLAWLHFPKLKAHLNALQAAQIARVGVQTQRGAVRDALTLFDENAALLLAPEHLWRALRDKDWQTLFVTQRELWGPSQLLLFGHALLEKLVTPRKAITAHVLVLPADVPAPVLSKGALCVAAWDEWLSQHLSAEHLQTKPYAPLPVLGVPGWCADNCSASFYIDATVFRPPKSATVDPQI